MKTLASIMAFSALASSCFGAQIGIFSNVSDQQEIGTGNYTWPYPDTIRKFVQQTSGPGSVLAQLGDASAAASISLEPLPELRASFAVGNTTFAKGPYYHYTGEEYYTHQSRYAANAASILVYSFMAVGPADTMVPVIVEGVARLALNGFSGGVGAEVRTNSTNLNFRGYLSPFDSGIFSITSDNQDVDSTSGQLLSTGEFEINFSFSTLIAANSSIDVTLLASAYGTSTITAFPGDFTSSGSAYLDPHIYIDPTFDNVDLYRLEVEPGVGNSPSVPDSGSTFSMLCVAILGLGTLRRFLR